MRFIGTCFSRCECLFYYMCKWLLVYKIPDKCCLCIYSQIHMAFLLVLLGILWGADATLTMDQGCNFVGSRFARQTSVCEEGFCSNLSRLMSGAIVSHAYPASVPLSCPEAVVTASSFLSEQSERVRGFRIEHDRPRVTALIHRLEDTLIPLLERLSLGLDTDPALVARQLAALDTAFLAAYADRPFERWHSDAPALLASPAIHRVAYLYDHVARTAVERALTYSVHRASLAMAIHFYFDLAAGLAKHFAHPSFLLNAPPGLFGTEPGFRSIDQREAFNGLPWTGVPELASDLLLVSAALSNIVRPEVPLNEDDMQVLYMLVSGWELSAKSSAMSLIWDQLTTTVCPQLDSIRSRGEELHAFVLSRVLLAFLDICNSTLSVEARRRLRDSLSIWRYGRLRGASGDPSKSSSVLPWQLGVVQSDQRTAFVATLLRKLMDAKVGFVDTGSNTQAFIFVDNDETAMLGFGRALGHAILHGVDLSFLRLHNSFVMMLHPRFRLQSGTVVRAFPANSSISADTFCFVIAGLEEILSMGGFELFRPEEWLRRFG